MSAYATDLHIIGPLNDITDLHKKIRLHPDDDRLLPSDHIATHHPPSFHERLAFQKHARDIRLWKRRPWPYPITCADMAQWETAGRPASSPHISYPQSTNQDRVNLAKCFALTIAKSPDMLAESAPKKQSAQWNHFIDAHRHSLQFIEEHTTMVQYAIDANRTMLVLSSPWTFNPEDLISFFLPDARFDLIQRVVDDEDYIPEYSLRWKGHPYNKISTRGIPAIYNEDGYYRTPSYTERRSLAAIGIDQAVLGVMFGCPDTEHRKKHRKSLASCQTMLRQDRKDRAQKLAKESRVEHTTLELSDIPF